MIRFPQPFFMIAIGNGRAEHETARRDDCRVNLKEREAFLRRRPHPAAERSRAMKRAPDGDGGDGGADQRGAGVCKTQPGPHDQREEQVFQRMLCGD